MGVSRRLLRGAIACTGLVLALAASAQTGVRFILPEYTKKFQGGPSKGTQFGIGLDHDLNDRLSLGVDLAFDVRSVASSRDRYGWPGITVTDGAYTGYYARGERMIAFTYRTAYGLSDDVVRLYIGSFIGVRHVKQQVELSYWEGASNVYDDGPFTQFAEGSRTVVPVGLRVGGRFGMIEEGYYMDVYVQAGHCIGGGRGGFMQRYLDTADGLALAKSAFTAGLALGFGW